MFSKDIALVKEHKNSLKKEYKVGETLTPVKVIGIGDKALSVLVFEASRFTSTPTWKQHFINYKKDIPKMEYAQLLLKEMIKAV